VNEEIAGIAAKISKGGLIDRTEATYLASRPGPERFEVLYRAGELRRRFFEDTVLNCAVLSAKQGKCSEDCAFCPQSVHHRSNIESHSLLPPEEIYEAAEAALEAGAGSFGIVTSGRSLRRNSEDFQSLCEAVRRVSELPLKVCASLGQLDLSDMEALKECGLRRVHHNLETSRRFFPEICSTHSYDDGVQTVEAAKAAGVEVCSGGLFGMGETWQDRIELAFALRELNVASIPLNFLIPRPGTPLEYAEPLPPLTILMITALFRFILPEKEIRICGGRETNLRDLQSWLFHAGANGLMIGNYLTVKGRPAQADIQMLKDLEMQF